MRHSTACLPAAMATVLDCPIKYSPHTKKTVLGSHSCFLVLWLCYHSMKHEFSEFTHSAAELPTMHLIYYPTIYLLSSWTTNNAPYILSNNLPTQQPNYQQCILYTIHQFTHLGAELSTLHLTHYPPIYPFRSRTINAAPYTLSTNLPTQEPNYQRCTLHTIHQFICSVAQRVALSLIRCLSTRRQDNCHLLDRMPSTLSYQLNLPTFTGMSLAHLQAARTYHTLDRLWKRVS